MGDEEQNIKVGTEKLDGNVFIFSIDFVYSSIDKYSSYPLYMEDVNNLVGFLAYRNPTSIRCAVNSNYKPLSFFISSKQCLFFTMMTSRDGTNDYCGLLSEVPVDLSSVKVMF